MKGFYKRFLKRLSTGGIVVFLVLLILFLVDVQVIHVHDRILSKGIKHWTGAMSSSKDRMRKVVSGDSTNTSLSTQHTSLTIPEFPELMERIDNLVSNTTYNGAFAKSTKGNLLNEDPPNFLAEFKNPCWYEKINLTDVQKNKLQNTCVRNLGENNTICKIISRKRLRCLPYFMLIGTPKSGSTDLYKRILDHPDVLSCARKEPHWWTRLRYRKKTFTNYIDVFSRCAETLQFATDDMKSAFITGEGSQSTFWDNTWWWLYPENHSDEEPGIVTANFVRHFLPNVKLLVILRNPIDRLYSGYLFFKPSTDISAEDFHRRATNEVTKFNKCITEHSLRHCAYRPTDHEVRLHIGLYVLYLKEWINIFPRDQILVLQLEDYSIHPQQAMSTVYQFLNLRDLSHEYGIKSGHTNSRKRKLLMSDRC